MIDRDVMKRDRCNHHANAHPQHRNAEDDPPPKPIHEHEVHGAEEEIRPRDCDCDGRRVVEAHEHEQRGGLVHQRVEAAQLGDRHNETGGRDGAAGRRRGEDALESDPQGLLGHALGRLRDGQLDALHLCGALFGRGGAVDAQEDCVGFCVAAVRHELAWGFGTEEEQAGQDHGQYGPDGDSCAPAFAV